MHKVGTSHFLIVDSNSTMKCKKLSPSRLKILEHTNISFVLWANNKEEYQEVQKHIHLQRPKHDGVLWLLISWATQTTKHSSNCRLQLILVKLIVFVLIENECFSQCHHLFPYMTSSNDPTHQVWKDKPSDKFNAQYTTEPASSFFRYHQNK